MRRWSLLPVWPLWIAFGAAGRCSATRHSRSRPAVSRAGGCVRHRLDPSLRLGKNTASVARAPLLFGRSAPDLRAALRLRHRERSLHGAVKAAGAAVVFQSRMYGKRWVRRIRRSACSCASRSPWCSRLASGRSSGSRLRSRSVMTGAAELRALPNATAVSGVGDDVTLTVVSAKSRPGRTQRRRQDNALARPGASHSTDAGVVTFPSLSGEPSFDTLRASTRCAGRPCSPLAACVVVSSCGVRDEQADGCLVARPASSRRSRSRVVGSGPVSAPARRAVEGLDPDASRWLSDELVRRRNAGAGVIVSSHRIHDLADVCDRCVFIVSGRLTPEVLAVDDLREASIEARCCLPPSIARSARGDPRWLLRGAGARAGRWAVSNRRADSVGARRAPHASSGSPPIRLETSSVRHRLGGTRMVVRRHLQGHTRHRRVVATERLRICGRPAGRSTWPSHSGAE